MMKFLLPLGSSAALLAVVLFSLASSPQLKSSTDRERDPEALAVAPGGSHQATFGTGCFWCSEAILQRIEGVISATPGYMGGPPEDAFYARIITGRTRHAEVTHLEFDPEIISYRELLEVFFAMHDPTTLNRQGNDVGPHYRSVIFTHTPGQRAEAEAMIAELTAQNAFPRPIVTEVTDALPFYPAEEKHLNFYNRNPDNRYCQLVILPKLRSLGLETKPLPES